MSKYVISESDRDLIRDFFNNNKMPFYYQNGDEMLMDDDMVLNIKKKLPMVQTFFTSKFGYNFDTFLSSRIKPYYKIYDYVNAEVLADDKYRAPLGIDFTTDLKIMLYKKTLTKNKGKPTSVEYYEKKIVNANGSTTYENIIARVDFTLVYDSAGFIIRKFAPLMWYKTDGTFDTENYKDLGEIYDPVLDHEKRIEEGILRRRAIVNGLQLPVFTILNYVMYGTPQNELLALARDFLLRFQTDFDNFVNSSIADSNPESPTFGMKLLAIEFMNAPDSWLDTSVTVPSISSEPITARQYIIASLSDI